MTTRKAGPGAAATERDTSRHDAAASGRAGEDYAERLAQMLARARVVVRA